MVFPGFLGPLRPRVGMTERAGTPPGPGEGMRRGLSTVQLGSPRLHRLALLQLPEKIGAEQALRRLLIYASVAGKTTATENREADQANDPFPTFFGNSK